MLGGCVTTIIPPAEPLQPTAVFVVDHGRTASLVIPRADGSMLRYAYGDWNYYALGKTDLAHGIAALLWPTQGALGRAELEGPVTLPSVRRQVSSIEYVHPVSVAEARVRAFEQDMEELYRSALDTQVHNTAYGLSFVHHPKPYTYFGNSNHAVAEWLRTLGCTTRGLAFHSRWRVQETGAEIAGSSVGKRFSLPPPHSAGRRPPSLP